MSCVFDSAEFHIFALRVRENLVDIFIVMNWERCPSNLNIVLMVLYRYSLFKKMRNVLIPFQNRPLLITCPLFYSYFNEAILHAVVLCSMFSV
jgi:hypothetical protein